MEDEPASTVVTVGGNQYTIWEEFAGLLVPDPSFFPKDFPEYVPTTLITRETHTLDESDYINENVDEFIERHSIQHFSNDDVWNREFLRIIVRQKGDNFQLKFGNKVHFLTNNDVPYLPNGPYLLNIKSGHIFSVARLLDDPLHAFLGGGIAYNPSNREYRSLHTTQYRVPSRLYHQPTPDQPLRGLRFAVKDVIDIAGMRTSNGSRGWLNTYSPAEESAPFVQQLTEAGAILVGKLNCTQFCDGQDPSERFEEVSPFNPRGDGYQKPSSSSSGSAVAAAGYDWLDFTIGTDTGGSIRHPAGVNGVYGIRPSLHAVDSRGMTASSFMDTVGVFARSAAMLEKAQKAMTKPWQAQNMPQHRATASSRRYKLLYPIRPKDADLKGYPRWFRHPEVTSPDELAEREYVFEKTVVKLEEYLNCQRQEFNMDELWGKTHPDGLDPNLAKVTGKIYQKLVYRATAKDVIEPFVAKHKELHDGRAPYLEPVFKRRCDYGAQVSEHEFDEAVRDFKIFKKWLREELFRSDPDEVIILLFPQSWGIPFYRDESEATPKGKIDPGLVFWEGFSLYSISYASGCPDITVPIGQMPYHSRITDHQELLPISLSVLSQPGNDLVLMGLLKDLEREGILNAVKTGSKTF